MPQLTEESMNEYLESLPRVGRFPRNEIIYGEIARAEQDKNLVKSIQSLPDMLLQHPHSIINTERFLRTELATQHHLNNVSLKDKPPLYLALGRKVGNERYAEGRYEDAISYYKEAIQMMSGQREDVLTTKFFNPTYTISFSAFGEKEWAICMDLMACCNNLAQCHLKINDVSSALDWLQELEVICECYRLSLFKYKVQGPVAKTKVLEHCTYRMKAAIRFINIFSKLGITAAVTHFSYLSTVHYPAHFAKGVPQIEKLLYECDAEKWFRSQHPIASSAVEWDVTETDLQVRGMWTRLNMRSDKRPHRRKQDGSWIWRNRLYVFGGVRTHTMENDLWYWDLNTSQMWTQLSEVPEDWIPFVRYCQTPIVYNDVVFFFSGFRTIVLFNLISETWDIVKTTFSGTWPYSEQLFNACVDIHKSQMYVFGGETFKESNSILMALDLENFRWRLLGRGDNSKGTYSIDWPKNRGSAACWIDPDKEQFCILYGIVQNLAENLAQDAPDDFWSYSIKSNSWTRERIRGNFPSPRFFMSAVYHQDLKSVILYGGMGSNTTVIHSPLPLGEREIYKYTIFGDAFIMDVSMKSWRQIVTRGFPTWRSAAHLLVDSSTGKIYLTGGSSVTDMTEPDDIPGENTRYFGDLWQLEIDSPDNQLDEKLFQDGVSFWRAGLYRKCYSCGNVGKNFFRCRGSCRGKYIFCSIKCQRSAWREHRDVHGCHRTLT